MSQPIYSFSNPHSRSQQQSKQTEEGAYNQQGLGVAFPAENPNKMDTNRDAMPMQNIYQRLNTTPEKLSEFCQKWHIAELSLFGSVLRDDFRIDGENKSDIDVLYLHMPTATFGFEIFDMKEELENLFDRRVDFVSKKAIKNSRNWLRRKSILESAQVIYEQRSAITH